MPEHNPVPLTDEEHKQLEVTKSFESSLPSPEPPSSKPFKIYEDVYLPEPNETNTDPSLLKSRQEQRELRRLKRQERLQEKRNKRQQRRELRQQTQGTDSFSYLPRRERRMAKKRARLEMEEQTQFQPQTFEDYKTQELQKEKQLDWTGWKENSLVRHGYEWLRTAMDSNYVPEYSIEGREIAMAAIQTEIDEIGDVKLNDYQNVRKLKGLWNKKYELRLKNEIDKQLMEADPATLEEMWEAITDNPEDVLFSMAQEMINKPELLLIPQVAFSRGAVVAGQAARAVAAGKKVTQAMEVVGGTAATYGAGVGIGTADRLLEQRAKFDKTDVARAIEQSQIDGVIGVLTVGGTRTFSKGLESYKTYKAIRDTAIREADRSVTELSLDSTRFLKDIEPLTRDRMSESYVDENGHVYTFEIKELFDLQERLDETKLLKDKYRGDQQALNAIEGVIQSTKREIKEAKGAAKEALEKRWLDLEQEKSTIRPSREVARKLFEQQANKSEVNFNYVSVFDKQGNKHKLRRLTPEVFEETAVRVGGVEGIALPGDFTANVTDGGIKRAWNNLMVSATAPIESLSQSSPTAKALLDLMNPRTTGGNRAAVYTISENVAYNHGRFLTRSNDIFKPIKDNKLEKELMFYMRGVQESKNPMVLKASTEIRELLNNVRTYAKEGGQLVDDSPDFLPRYYNRESLKTQEQRNKLAEQVVLNDSNRDFETIQRSAMDIFRNVQKETDESTRVNKGNQSFPIGFRKWKDVPDSALNEFLDSKFIEGIDRYIMNAVRRTEVDKVFGRDGKDLEEMLQRISDELEQRDDFATNPNARILEDHEVKAIRDLYELAKGTYGNRPSDVEKSVVDSAMSFETVTKLGLSTITSMAEPMTLLFKLNEGGQNSQFFKTYAGMVGGLKLKKLWGDMSHENIKREAKEMGLITEQATQERIAAMTGEGMEGWPAKVSNTFLKGVGLHHWTELNRVMAYEAGKRDILKSIKGLVVNPDSPLSTSRNRWLAEMNIDKDLAIEWFKEGAKAEGPVYESIKRGATRKANFMIANPDKFNKAKWLSHNNSLLRVVAQYKSFASSFANTVMGDTYDEIKKLWNEGRRGAATRKMAGAVALVSGMSYWATYRGLPPEDETPEEFTRKMVAGVSSMGVPGASLLDPIAKGYGVSGILGPTFSDLEKVTRGRASVENIVPVVKKGKNLIEDN